MQTSVFVVFVTSAVVPVNTLQFTASPGEIIVGLQTNLTFTCIPGVSGSPAPDLSQVMLLQISHEVNGTTVPIADVSSVGATIVDKSYTLRAKADGDVANGPDKAYIALSLSMPGSDDAGTYHCHMSALDTSGLLTTRTATSQVLVTDLASVASEVDSLREEIREKDNETEALKEEMRQLLTRKGTAFTASLFSDVLAGPGTLTFQLTVLDTDKGLDARHGRYTVPRAGNYLLSLTLGVCCRESRVKAVLRSDGAPLARVVALSNTSSNGTGQGSATVAAALDQGAVIDVDVEEFTPSATILGSYMTFLSGVLLQA